MEIQINSKPATTSEAVTAINRAIAHHEKYSRLGTCVPGNASGRRQMEKDAEYRVEITIDNDVYVFDGSASVSCRWVRYSGSFTVNGVKKNVRLFKGLLETLAIADFEAWFAAEDAKGDSEWFWDHIDAAIGLV